MTKRLIILPDEVCEALDLFQKFYPVADIVQFIYRRNSMVTRTGPEEMCATLKRYASTDPNVMNVVTGLVEGYQSVSEAGRAYNGISTHKR